MVKEVIIDSIDDVLPLITEQEYREDLGRNRSLYVYRGMPNVDFQLQTSLYRNCKNNKKELEPCILMNFTKYGVLEDPAIERSVWRQMILGQHHGLPTRLLDWSHSPLIALHFATTERDLNKMNTRDCMIWRIDIKEMHSLLPKAYQDKLNSKQTSVFTVDMLNEITGSLSQYDSDMSDKSMVVIEPPSIDPRIVNQYSFFSIVPDAVNDIEGFLDANTNNTVKYVIKKELRWRVRDMLDQQNISERILYQGLDGLSLWLGRHYFVV
ncbi:MAG: FRG domain-containing protein [Lachnospiraceae bacterium]|nr:FRG domain-containing protein [Candidatus Merdinaster equi]